MTKHRGVEESIVPVAARVSHNFVAGLRLPLMAAPMSIASTPALVSAACRAGVAACFPTHNAWRADGLDSWVQRLSREQAAARRLGHTWAPFAVNINVSRSKPAELLEHEIDICRRAAVQIVTTNVGNPAEAVRRVHDWGGIVIHDVTTVEQAERAASAGVDGLMLVCAGAGGLGGQLSPFAFVPRVRNFFDGIIQLAGGIATGRGIAAAQTLGADMVCMGTRFMATQESGVVDEHKRMLADADLADVLWTDAICGVPANFLRPSIIRQGLDPDELIAAGADRRPTIPTHIKPWSMVWSGGQSVGAITSVPSVEDLIAELERDYDAAAATAPW